MSSITGQRIKIERSRSSLSQDDLAEKLGYKRTNIANYEAGRVTPPSDALAKMARIFNVSSDYLLGLDDVDGIGEAIANEMKNLGLEVIDLSAATGALPNEIRACIEENNGLSETLLHRIVKKFGMNYFEFLLKYDLYSGAIPKQFYGNRDTAVEVPDRISSQYDREDWTDEELETIKQFKDFVRFQRKKR
ncbi:helix-turn-helix protein [Paenibacillus barcinonensis]|uniref:Helix-turn-helix protein n=1 Tax=Paenibacillus barcinonensis TaxID=198119 RepID=A0A2V4UPF8_PAEBA|nr:helix-turn-helix transcriptional regulator [Paenibacillus barcinonensis]PYE42117.1 helix-turn-helix protein [Paenibacillus barcinonensis]